MRMNGPIRSGSLLSILVLVGRSAVWKATPHTRSASLLTLIAFTIVGLATQLAYSYLSIKPPVRFTPYGLNSSLATTLVFFAIVAMFVRPRRRVTALCAVTGLSVVYQLAVTALVFGQRLIPFDFDTDAFASGTAAIVLLYLIALIWWLGALSAILRSIEPQRRWAILRACALYLVAAIALSAMPVMPTFRGNDFDLRRANYWEYISAYREGRLFDRPRQPTRVVDGDEVELSQAALLDKQLSQLTRHTKGKAEIYAIGLAGAASEDVFVKELKGGLDSLAHFFPLDGGVVQLINHPQTVGSTPVASRQNFATVVRSVARVMDPESDVLLLFMTSHGSGDGISLSLPGAVWSGLSPNDVAKVLEEAHIQNRIIIVSACYSGIFLAPLANENSIVITAADGDHTSFGCSNERDWTYFGDAFFNRSLRPGGTIEEAFLDAKVAVAQWEARDDLPPSNPQGYFGTALMKKLTPLYLRSKDALHFDLSLQH